MEMRVIERLPDLEGCSARAAAFAFSVGEEVHYNVLSFVVESGGIRYVFSPWGDTAKAIDQAWERLCKR